MLFIPSPTLMQLIHLLPQHSQNVATPAFCITRNRSFLPFSNCVLSVKTHGKNTTYQMIRSEVSTFIFKYETGNTEINIFSSIFFPTGSESPPNYLIAV